MNTQCPICVDLALVENQGRFGRPDNVFGGVLNMRSTQAGEGVADTKQ